MDKTILDHIAIYLFRKFQYTKIMAINMCEPRHFIIGNITKRLMWFANQKIRTAVENTVDQLIDQGYLQTKKNEDGEIDILKWYERQK